MVCFGAVQQQLGSDHLPSRLRFQPGNRQRVPLIEPVCKAGRDQTG